MRASTFRTVAVAALATTLVAGLASYAAEPAAKQAEPPLEFTLEVDGKPVEVVADKAVKLKVGDREVDAVVRVKPTRLLETPDFTFRYPRDHAFEYERDEDTATWTLDGNDCVVILTRYAAKVGAAEIAPALIKEISSQLGGPEQSPTKFEFLGKPVDGTRLLATIAGQKIVQSVFAFEAGGATYSIVVQDSSGNVEPTAETKNVFELLKSTSKPK